MEMEVQWTIWVAGAVWALHRTFETGARRYAGMLGAFVALQFMSSIYYGLFLATLLALCALLLLCGLNKEGLKSGVSALAIAAVTALVLSAPYALPYAATKHPVVAPPEPNRLRYSPRPSTYPSP